MKVIPLGRVVVPTPGTPVPLSTVISIPYTEIAGVVVRQFSANTGKVYFGNLSLNKSSGAGVIAELQPAPASGITDHYKIQAGGADVIDPSQFEVDAAVSNEGPLVTLYVR
jgi:hypothetical protein